MLLSMVTCQGHRGDPCDPWQTL